MKLNIPLLQKIMRLTWITTIIIISATHFLTAENLKGQVLEQRIDLSYRSANAKTILKDLRERVGINFAYTNHLDLEKITFTDVYFKDQSLEYVLKTLFRGRQIAFSEQSGTISLYAIQRPGRIIGTITDEKGEILAGASLKIVELDRHFGTDNEGAFSVNVQPGRYTVEVNYISYRTARKTVSVTADGLVDASFVLRSEEGALGEVVVTALGIGRAKKQLGYAVGEVPGETINMVPQENVLGGLSGKISGVDIRRSGNDLNAETYVYVRGRTSLAGNDEPLVVVDGVPVGGTAVMADISAMNIEKVSVLKGASAAALYGSRAGNGVILITTKSGRTAKGLGISVNTNVTPSIPYRYIELQNKFTNGRRGVFNEADGGRWFGPEEGTPAIHFGSDGEEKPMQFYDNALRDYFQTGVTTINDIGVTGGYDKGSFQLSLSQMDGKGIFPGMELKRLGLGLTAVYKVTNKVSLTTNVNVSNPKSDNYTEINDGGDDLYYDVYNTPPHVDINDLKDDYWATKNVQQRKVTDGYSNPWFSAYERKRKFDNVRGFGNLRLDWEIAPSWKTMLRAAYSSTDNKEEILKPWSFDGFSGASRPKGSYHISNKQERESNVDFLTSYDKKVGDFTFAPAIGANIMYQDRSALAAGGNDLALPGLYTLANVMRGGLEYESGRYEKRVYSVYGMASLGYKNSVFVDLTARNDWSSTLPKENRSYFYPSISTSVLLSEMVDVPEWVSMLKLRGGWAKVGKDTDPYLIQPTLTQGYWGDAYSYSLPSSMPNSSLKPEIATSYELGTDLSFFKGRVGLDATYYKAQNKNQILNVGISPMTGYTSTTINAGNVENSGIELGLLLVPVKKKELEWNMRMNFTKERSRLVELVDGIDRVSFGGGSGQYAFTDVGGVIGDLYSFDVMKVEEGEYKGWNLLDANGRWKIQEDLSKLPKVGRFTNDFAIGLTTMFTYKKLSLSASFDWRQGGQFFSESMKRLARDGKVEDWKNGYSSSTFAGVLGANSFNGDRDQLANEIKNNADYRDHNVWIGGRNGELGGFPFNGGENGAFFPGVIDNGNGTYTENFGAEGTKMFDAYRFIESSGSFWRTGYAFMYDASFVKMRDITLTYQLPDRLAHSMASQKISLSLYAKNVILWTKAGINIDPESAYNEGQQGFEKWNTAPWTIPVGFNLNITF
ncbi:SusC/RagA family TonB-linked outer membrane protein [Sphingobacterium alkalisoli]|uniref:SusC/RagA family TonB-linked outer membrane protein n=1 Tax=Sphingobacterium alkalisoli TaxID=1874115 RepID=A0A4U0GR65_9SPHI|nr:SusC/RagA family TonB-linked outer membrane protein [Sphingobacterium alkalisoli]TJY61450.1 SusC/RagA family TonB-linked outer membrane protein [Sphingobacterium alkalisoli]GGH30319.1 hypothetical protein GCM10011418_42270 [Sphingobacterium alkalisoli]